MLLTIETTHQPATDLGFLLHKNPAGVHTAEHPYGMAYIFYPVATAERCQVAVLLDVEPLKLVRQPNRAALHWALGQYVNDRPYAVTSLLSTVISQELRSALKGRSKERAELAETALPLTTQLCAVVCPLGEAFLRQLFEPLGYNVTVETYPPDEAFPDWGPACTFKLTLAATKLLSELLTHLYVLIPVLDDSKHYWVSDDEIRKLLEYGAGWLANHPARELIARRYLKHQGGMAREALAQLADGGEPEADEAAQDEQQEERALERTLNLQAVRIGTVARAIVASGAQRVLDLGCGEGALLAELITASQTVEVVGVDVSLAALNGAAKRLQLERMPEPQRRRLTLLQSALTYCDDRLVGFDAAALVEVIEHLDPPRLRALEASVFGYARPATVVVTTPNREYNVRWASLPAGTMRHRDHRFEWTRAEFEAWAQGVAAEHGFSVSFASVGEDDPQVGPPTQMAVFAR